MKLKREQTMQLIVNETLLLASQYGIDDVKVSMIINNLNINRGTFYRYFHDKYDVIYHCENQLIGQITSFQKHIINQNIHDLRQDLDQGLLIGQVIDLLDEHQKLMQFIFSDHGDIRFYNQFEKCFHDINISTLTKLNPFINYKQTELIATFITSAVIGLFKLHLNNLDRFNRQDLLDASYNLIRQNLLNKL